MLKMTMMLGSFDRLLGETNMAQAIELARRVEEAGLYAIAIGEHVSLSSSLEDYPYAGGLQNADGGRKPYLEPAVLLGAFGAVTSRLKLSTCVMLAPLRPAVLLAKQLATIDVLSNGRLQPVFGTGWSRAEYASLNVDFSKRRQILRDNIAACRALWEHQPATFRSESVSFDGLFSMPQPAQPRIPILLAAKANEKNAALVAELCDGWETGPDDSKSIEKLREGVTVYRNAYSAAGRDPNTLIVRSHLLFHWTDRGEVDWDKTFSVVPAMLEAGVNEFACGASLGIKGTTSLEGVTRFIEQVARMAKQF